MGLVLRSVNGDHLRKWLLFICLLIAVSMAFFFRALSLLTGGHTAALARFNPRKHMYFLGPKAS